MKKINISLTFFSFISAVSFQGLFRLPCNPQLAKTLFLDCKNISIDHFIAIMMFSQHVVWERLKHA